MMLGSSPKLPLPSPPPADGDLDEESSDRSVTSPITRPSGRAVAKTRRKGKSTDDLIAEIRAMRIIRQRELGLMFESRKERVELERKKIERMKLKMKASILAVLIGKDRLSPEEEEMKGSLMSVVFPK